jgi:hypothetical protein
MQDGDAEAAVRVDVWVVEGADELEVWYELSVHDIFRACDRTTAGELV